MVELLRLQKKQQEVERRRKKQETLIKELRKRKSGWENEEELRAKIPVLDNPHAMGIKGFIRRALGAQTTA